MLEGLSEFSVYDAFCILKEKSCSLEDFLDVDAFSFCVEEGVLAIKPVLSTSRVGHGPPCHLAEPTEQPQKRIK